MSEFPIPTVNKNDQTDDWCDPPRGRPTRVGSAEGVSHELCLPRSILTVAQVRFAVEVPQLERANHSEVHFRGVR